MNSNYVAEIQSTCIPNEQLVAEQHVANLPVDGNMLLVAAFTPGQHVISFSSESDGPYVQ